MYAFKEAGYIDQMVLGVFLNSIGDNLDYGSPRSNIIIGGYDLDYSSSPNCLFYADVTPEQNMWETAVSGINVEEYASVAATQHIIIDMTYYYIMIDRDTMDALVNALSKKFQYGTTYYDLNFMYYFLFTNEKQVPSVSFTLGNNNLTIPSEMI